ncbi:metal-binding protein [Halobaculum sp. WSA2]|uniref:Metal-binding protein n=1 Tax=Halobaculum saliterrae TaxID=2073113 RepID=A0A6B0T6M1_9EURY|nr:UPF0058 family protein [Halobaculum saliterrae]MXR42139.1 metal-binding protein [Halobaculum saliterrae]
MRKNELVHLHALLRIAAGYLSTRGELPDDALQAYESLGVTPMSMRADREDHEAAVLALATALAATTGGSDDGAEESGGVPNAAPSEASTRAIEESPPGSSPE